MPLIHAYFDDAGTHWGAEITAIGGLVGTTEAWTAFNADWRTVLDDFREQGLNAFHAYDCEVGEGDFKKLSREIREAISGRFARVIRDHTELRVFWSAVVNDDWEAIVDQAFRERYERPFGLCFEWCAQQVAGWSKRYFSGSSVSLIFSEQLDFRDRMHEIFEFYRDSKWFEPLKVLKFASYRDVLPLQGADLVATEMMRYWRSVQFDAGKLSVRKEIEELQKGRGLHLGGCYDKPALTSAVQKYGENLAAYRADHENWRRTRWRRPRGDRLA